jgi:hypothetical protein
VDESANDRSGVTVNVAPEIRLALGVTIGEPWRATERYR